MSTQSALIGVQDLIERKSTERDRLIKVVEKLDMDIQSARQTLAMLAEDVDSEAVALSGVSVRDLAGCRTQQEGLRKIAELTDGVIRVNDVADLLIAAGLASGLPSSAVSSAHRVMTNSPDWEWVAPGVFRLNSVVPRSGTNRASSSPSPRRRAALSPYSPSLVNFNGARNHAERLARIAQEVNGIVDIKRAALTLIDAGLAKGQINNVRSALGSVMRASPEWEKCPAPRTWRHLPTIEGGAPVSDT